MRMPSPRAPAAIAGPPATRTIAARPPRRPRARRATCVHGPRARRRLRPATPTRRPAVASRRRRHAPPPGTPATPRPRRARRDRRRTGGPAAGRARHQRDRLVGQVGGRSHARRAQIVAEQDPPPVDLVADLDAAPPGGAQPARDVVERHPLQADVGAHPGIARRDAVQHRHVLRRREHRDLRGELRARAALAQRAHERQLGGDVGAQAVDDHDQHARGRRRRPAAGVDDRRHGRRQLPVRERLHGGLQREQRQRDQRGAQRRDQRRGQLQNDQPAFRLSSRMISWASAVARSVARKATYSPPIWTSRVNPASAITL